MTQAKVDTQAPCVEPVRIQASEFIDVLDLGEEEYVAWNRFNPKPTLLNDTTLGILRGDVDGFSEEELAYCRDMFLEASLAYEGDVDRSRERFLEKIGIYSDRLERGDAETANPHYKTLTLSNDPCNVGCSYCMIPKFKEGAQKLVSLGKKPPPARKGMLWQEKLEHLKKVVDQYIQSRIAAGETESKLSMTGGEFLAQWRLVKGIVEYVAETYPDHAPYWEMNSSLTILNEEQAEFLGKHKVKVYTSIDGYKENHDKFRTYHNGRGTFDDVVKGVELYNKHSPENALKAFQGTIAKADEFDPNKLFDFATGDFVGARMGPNLLGVSPDEGEKQADLMMDLYIAGDELGFNFGDKIFENMKAHIRLKGEARFDLYCMAMTNPVDHAHITVNVSTMQATRSCSFVPSAHVPLADVGGDIFHESVWDQNAAFAQERLDTIEENCLDCEVAGVCRGSCVLNGIDANNQINPGGCAYLRRLWRRLVAYLLERGERIPSRTANPVRIDELRAKKRDSRSLKVVQ